jgi:hypothetical protein
MNAWPVYQLNHLPAITLCEGLCVCVTHVPSSCPVMASRRVCRRRMLVISAHTKGPTDRPLERGERALSGLALPPLALARGAGPRGGLRGLRALVGLRLFLSWLWAFLSFHWLYSLPA